MGDASEQSISDVRIIDKVGALAGIKLADAWWLLLLLEVTPLQVTLGVRFPGVLYSYPAGGRCERSRYSAFSTA